MTRREIRETVFKILFSLEFNDISEIREEVELELEHASLYDEDEIKFDEDIPVKVAINEAVELAKTYCDVEAKSFINALLAKLAD